MRSDLLRASSGKMSEERFTCRRFSDTKVSKSAMRENNYFKVTECNEFVYTSCRMTL